MSDNRGGVAAWLPAAKAGSPEALGQALEACRGYLLLIAQRELDPALQAKGGASDLVQETFLNAHRAFGRFEGDSEGDLLAWLRQMLLNKLADFQRHYRQTGKRQISREVVLRASDSSTAPGAAPSAAVPTPSVQAMQLEQGEAARRVLEGLPEEYRRVLALRYQDDRSFEEIGRLLGRTPNAARKLLLRAIERVQRDLKDLT